MGKANLPYFGWVGTLVGKANLPCFGSAGPEPYWARPICLISAGPWARQNLARNLSGQGKFALFGLGEGRSFEDLYFLMLWDSRVGGCYVYTLDTTEPYPRYH